MSKSMYFIIAAMICLPSVLFLAGAGYFAYDNINYKRSAVKTKGTIVELIERTTSSSNNSPSTTYAPVYTYTDGDGNTFKKKSSYSTYPPIGQVGDSLDVLYDPENPENAKIDTWFSNWGAATILGGMAAGGFFIGCVFCVVGIKRG